MNILTHGTDFAQAHQRSPAKVARRIEGLFFQILMKEMRSSLPASGWLGAGASASYASDLFGQAIAHQVAGALDLGLVERLSSQVGLAERSAVEANEGSRALAFGSLPVAGRITSGYGYRRDPISGQRRFHHGLDIGAPRGSPVRSLTAGRVIHAGALGDFGQTVRIRAEDGTDLLYAHCGHLAVRVGERVQRGTVLAEVDSSGRSTGPHLHLEVRLRGASVDPLSWLERRPLVPVQETASGVD